MSRKGKLVYSTGPSGPSADKSWCPHCGRRCRCQGTGPAEPRESLPPAEQRVRVRRDRSGRRGKTVTVIAPLVLVRADAEALLSELKRARGVGGTLKLDTDAKAGPCFVIELQGDHVDAIVADLARRGHDAKRSGG